MILKCHTTFPNLVCFRPLSNCYCSAAQSRGCVRRDELPQCMKKMRRDCKVELISNIYLLLGLSYTGYVDYYELASRNEKKVVLCLMVYQYYNITHVHYRVSIASNLSLSSCLICCLVFSSCSCFSNNLFSFLS